MAVTGAIPSYRRLQAPASEAHLALASPASSYARYTKRAIDAALATVLLLLVLPVLALVALAVRLSLGKGVVFRQERVGRGGVPFTMYKFRTMAHERRRRDLAFVGDERRLTHKHPDDPRHTVLGRFLRKTSLDELPQLFNVVLGDMSLIGPRPELPAVVTTYEPWEHRRHTVRPGITGSWQVSAHRDRPIREAIDLDLAYVDGVTLSEDCRILVKTVPALLRSQTF